MSSLLPASITPMTRLEGQSRRKLSVTIGVILALLVMLFYAVTVVRLQGNVAKRLSMQSGASMPKQELVTPVRPTATSNTKQAH